ncbi:LysE family transporter [bacterium]|nr:LysE family transporter [bacterium]
MKWLLPFLSYVIVVTFTPGPNNVIAMAIANNCGLKKSYKFIFGITSGVFIIFNLASFFNIFLLNIAPVIRPYTAIAGAIYMTYLGIVFLIQPEEKDMQKKELSYIQGILLQFINPKVLLYALTVYSTFIIPNASSKGVIFLFGIFLAVTAFTATSLWALFGAVFQRFLKKYRRPFNIAMAILLFYSAVSISGLLDII